MLQELTQQSVYEPGCDSFCVYELMYHAAHKEALFCPIFVLLMW